MIEGSIEERRRAVRIGWIEAAAYTFAIGVLSVVYAIGSRHGMHVMAFILYSVLFSGVALVALTGALSDGGSQIRAIAASPLTWVIGLGNVVLEAAFFVLLGLVPPADGSLLARLAIPVSLIAGLVLLRRRPSTMAAIGGAIIAVAVVAFGFWMPAGNRALAFGLALLTGTLISVRGFASEFHPANRAARTVMDKLRVTGVIVLVTAAASAVLTVILMAAIAAGLLPAFDLVPRLDQVLHLPTVLLALLVGALIFTAMNYLQFSAVVKIETSNFVATSAFMPIATLIVQMMAAGMGLLAVPHLEWRLIPVMAVVIVGVMLMIWGSRRS